MKKKKIKGEDDKDDDKSTSKNKIKNKWQIMRSKLLNKSQDLKGSTVALKLYK